MSRRILCVVAVLATLFMTGCSNYKGLNSLSLPGNVGTGSDSYQVTVQLENAANLVPNVPVLVNNINVGTVTNVGLDGLTPTLTLSLRNDVKLPANAMAKLGQTSLLGSKHIELGPPTDGPEEGTLTAGSVIRENESKRYPATEEVLAGVSLLLNGGGLQHFQTITSELNRALGGRENDVRDFLTQLNTFTGGLDDQKEDIVTAIHGLDRFSGTLAPRMSTIETALQTLPQGLATLNQQEPALMRALDKLSAASRSIAPFADGGSDDLRGVLNEIAPVLRGIGDTQKGSVMSALKTLPFVIFPLDTIPYMYRGDYANVTVTLDLTHQALDQAFLTGTPAAGALAAAAKVQQGKSPGVAASRAGNPLLLPLGEQATPPPAAQAPIGTLPPPPTPQSDKSGSGLIDKAVPGIGG